MATKISRAQSRDKTAARTKRNSISQKGTSPLKTIEDSRRESVMETTRASFIGTQEMIARNDNILIPTRVIRRPKSMAGFDLNVNMQN